MPTEAEKEALKAKRQVEQEALRAKRREEWEAAQARRRDELAATQAQRRAEHEALQAQRRGEQEAQRKRRMEEQAALQAQRRAAQEAERAKRRDVFAAKQAERAAESQRVRRLRLALRISLAAGYAYKNAPKCGCSTIKRALWWAEREMGRFDVPHERAYQGGYLHAVNSGTPFVNDVDEIDGKVIFTFVRNPYARLYSAWLDKCVFAPSNPDEGILPVLAELGVGRREVGFPEFLAFIKEQSDLERDTHWRSIWHVTAEDLLPSHYLGSLEQIEEGLRDIFAVVYPGYLPEIENTNSRRNIAAAPPTSADFDAIADIYANDFEFYGYSFDPAKWREPPSRRGWQRPKP